jgi:uncharacterized protein YndB with AHSA1/START domain
LFFGAAWQPGALLAGRALLSKRAALAVGNRTVACQPIPAHNRHATMWLLMNRERTAMHSTDSIERSIHIKSPRTRVWRALANADEFGRWFGANLAGQRFAPGQPARGPLTIKGYEHVVFDAIVDRIEPEQLLSYRWHPYAVDPAVDYSAEERTLVTFTLQDAPGGTLLTVVESGFDKVPAARRADALRMNTRGWEAQLKSIEAHVAAH